MPTLQAGEARRRFAQRPQRFFRLGYAAIPEDMIEPGIAALGSAWQEMRASGK